MTAPGSLSRLLRACRLCSWLLGLVLLSQCAPRETLLAFRDPARIARMHETFGYRKWVAPDTRPDVVIIGIHGFDGASLDYENLGQSLLRDQPRTALYAYEVRGQGNDPKRSRRGDIDQPADWYHDLATFTRLTRERHPRAKIVWMGESMGALILSHAWRESPPHSRPCDAIILSSPVVRIREDIPRWKIGVLDLASSFAPLARVSLEQLSGGHDVQMTHDTKHTEQADTNAWHVEKNTLRLLSTLGRKIRTMDDCAATFRVPVLVLHGSKDYLTSERAIRGFVASIPRDVPVTTHIYPDAYHLLMYDRDKEQVFADIREWVDKTLR